MREETLELYSLQRGRFVLFESSFGLSFLVALDISSGEKRCYVEALSTCHQAIFENGKCKICGEVKPWDNGEFYTDKELDSFSDWSQILKVFGWDVFEQMVVASSINEAIFRVYDRIIAGERASVVVKDVGEIKIEVVEIESNASEADTSV